MLIAGQLWPWDSAAVCISAGQEYLLAPLGSGLYILYTLIQSRIPLSGVWSWQCLLLISFDHGSLLKCAYRLDRSICWLHLAQVYTYTFIPSRISLSGVLLDSAYRWAALTLGLCCNVHIGWTVVYVKTLIVNLKSLEPLNLFLTISGFSLGLDISNHWKVS